MNNILIIDDDDSMHDILEHIFPEGSYNKIFKAYDSSTGLDVAHMYKPEIIFLDYNLPDDNGVTTCMKLKSIFRYNPKVIIMSGCIDTIQKESYEIVNADAIIDKDRLIENIEMIINLLNNQISQGYEANLDRKEFLVIKKENCNG